MWAHALLESVVAAERLVIHFQARAAADLAELAGNYPGLREHLATEIALALGCSESTASRRLEEAEETAAGYREPFPAGGGASCPPRK